MIDVIILNWQRPQHVKDTLIPMLAECPEVGQVIVSHGRQDTYFEAPNASVRCLDHAEDNASLGLARRFHCAQYAQTDAVLILDDDQILTPVHIRQLAASYAARPGHIHGYDARYAWHTRGGLVYGRRKTMARHFADPVFLEQMMLRPPPPCIVLTKTMIAPREALENFCAHMRRVEDFVREHARPLWNGEDIYFNLLHLKLTGRWPVIHKPAARRAEIPDAEGGISGDKAAHFAYRTAFLRHACEVLDLAL